MAGLCKYRDSEKHISAINAFVMVRHQTSPRSLAVAIETLGNGGSSSLSAKNRGKLKIAKIGQDQFDPPEFELRCTPPNHRNVFASITIVSAEHCFEVNRYSSIPSFPLEHTIDVFAELFVRSTIFEN